MLFIVKPCCFGHMMREIFKFQNFPFKFGLIYNITLQIRVLTRVSITPCCWCSNVIDVVALLLLIIMLLFLKKCYYIIEGGFIFLCY